MAVLYAILRKKLLKKGFGANHSEERFAPIKFINNYLSITMNKRH